MAPRTVLLPVLAALLAAVLAAILAVGCATSSGRLYRDTAGAEKRQVQASSGGAAQVLTVEPGEQAQVGLKIESNPDSARVYLNDRFVGETPLLLTDIEKGHYRLVIEKRGYYPFEVVIDYTGGTLAYTVDLQLITGYLKVDVFPNTAEVTVDGKTIVPSQVEELSVGRQVVRIRAFGYEEQSLSVEIAEKNLTALSVTLQEASFRLENLHSNREVFNPRNPGLLGRARIRYRVSTYGSGTATVLDAAGTPLLHRDLARFTTWEQSFDWNGRSESGALQPDGSYTVRIEASGEGDGQIASLQLSLRIDSSLVLAYRSLWSGASGLMYAPSPEILPLWSVQAATNLVAHVEPVDGDLSFRVPWNFGLRLGVSPANLLELDLQGGAILGYAEVVPFFLSAALKASLFRRAGEPGFSTGVLARLAYQSVRTDPLANFTGLGLGLPTMASIGRVTLLLTPELVFSPWSVSYDPGRELSFADPAFTTFAYGRLGLILDLNPVILGLSASARTLPFGQGFGLDLPLQCALEAHWMLPGTQLFLSFEVAGEVRALRSFYFMAGGGLGLLN
jgi:hypothetical protein